MKITITKAYQELKISRPHFLKIVEKLKIRPKDYEITQEEQSRMKLQLTTMECYYSILV